MQWMAWYSPNNTNVKMGVILDKRYPDSKKSSKKEIIRRYINDMQKRFCLEFQCEDICLLLQQFDKYARQRGCPGGTRQRKENEERKVLIVLLVTQHSNS